MPLYEYHCESCGRRFEKIVKFSDPPLETCPTCGHGPVRKLMSSPAFHLKGTGWYATDYAKKDQAPAGKTESSRDGQEGKDAKEGKEGRDGKDAKDSKDKTETKSEASADGKSDKSSSTDTSSPSAPATDAAPKSPKRAG
jgi:putative FmdB family regulatory protein